jgi:GT2 family glycosyltransferase
MSSAELSRIDVSILIVSYRTRELVLRCIDSIARHSTAVTYEVIVVDNDAETGTADAVSTAHPATIVLQPGANIGFAAAVNQAASKASGELLLLLNPDTRVLDGAVDRLVAFARAQPGHGLYGGRTVDTDGRLDPRSCWGRPTLWSHICFGTGLSAVARGSRWFDPESLGGWNRDSIRSVGVVTGCLCLIERNAWDVLGGFDEQFFLYGEDVDLSLRARDAGFDPVVTPDATVEHVVGASTSSRADKFVLVMTGKATVARRRWRGPARVLAVTMLALGVALRARLAPGQGWDEVWRQRSRWLPGYPPAA